MSPRKEALIAILYTLAALAIFIVWFALMGIGQ